MKALILLLLLMYSFAAGSQQLQQNISVHDPVMTKDGDTFYVFATGRGINVWSSKDKINWKREKAVFSEGPQWAINAVKGFKDFIWAPDIQFINGKYYLYYCVSVFGKNTSAIGVATNATLDEKSPSFKWQDHGFILESIPGKTNWNAIDPNVFIDADKNAWLTFGSFWGGIQLLKLNKDLVSVSTQSLKAIKTIASYRNATNTDVEETQANAIEAPFVFKKGKYYYLFASIGFCCRGSKSTYRMIVGRSKEMSGPYLDEKGRDMNEGGGLLIMKGNADWYGVGHNAAYTFDCSDYLLFHGYDAKDKAKPKLRIEQLIWKNGWPSVSASPRFN
ncbi:MAG: arabinan endo-1,5-alpha-L-arabinosidase [Pedobacter sp.]|nr:MAG: arabinan endo-1,5-alpha-L-arabinosidase [Pedobacter sp.]